MKRREPTGAAVEVPPWVRRVGFGAIRADIAAGVFAGPMTIERMHAEHMRRIAASERLVR